MRTAGKMRRRLTSNGITSTHRMYCQSQFGVIHDHPPNALILGAHTCGRATACKWLLLARSEIELPSASALEASLTPLSEATGGAFGGLDAGSLADADLDGQRAIQLCMKQQGFEYVATVPIDDLPLEQVVFYGSLPETAAIAEEGGFGLAAQFDRAVSAMTVEEIIAADPNTVITGTLSEAELEAYELALWGDEPPTEGQPFVPDVGCVGEGFLQTQRMFQFSEDFAAPLEELRLAVAADPVVVSALRSWTMCMAEAGFLFEDPISMVTDLEREFGDLRDRHLASQTGSGPSLGDLRVKERTVAVAHNSCAAPYEASVGEIRAEYERDFVQVHEEALTKFVNSA